MPQFHLEFVLRANFVGATTYVSILGVLWLCLIPSQFCGSTHLSIVGDPRLFGQEGDKIPDGFQPLPVTNAPVTMAT